MGLSRCRGENVIETRSLSFFLSTGCGSGGSA
jgi:hypothetical protein